MPLYSVLCTLCGLRGQVFRRVEERDDRLVCDCGGPQQRLIDAPYLRPEIEPYLSPATGKVISSRAQRKEDLAQAGAIEWEPGLKEAIAARRAEKFEETLQQVDALVDNVARDVMTSGGYSA